MPQFLLLCSGISALLLYLFRTLLGLLRLYCYLILDYVTGTHTVVWQHLLYVKV